MAMFEICEARVLMSASPAQMSAAIKAIHTAEAVVKADLKALAGQIKHDQGIIGTDLKKPEATNPATSFVATASSVEKAVLANVGSRFKTDSAAINALANKLVSDAKNVARKPGSSTSQALIAGDISTLSGRADAAINAFENAINLSTLYTALNSIAIANPSYPALSTDINSVTTGLSSLTNQAENDANTLFEVKVQELAVLFEG